MVRRTRPFTFLAAAAGLGVLTTFLLVTVRAQPATPVVAIDADDIGGVVTGPNGPEAGVWVIAETRDLPVRYIKIVVTDDRGRYLVPDLPQASYSVWVRGYGLVDSAKTTTAPGRLVNLTATPAPNAAAAAQYYPAIYWYSMLRIPAAGEFGAQGDIPKDVTQATWLDGMKSNGCIGCHQLGQRSTRTIPAAFGTVRHRGADAWTRRVQSGQAGAMMLGQLQCPRAALARVVRRLDRSRRQGRTAARHAHTAPGRRAQHRRHTARVDGREALPARPDRQRPAASHGQRERPAVRIAQSTAPTCCRSSTP